MRSLSLRSSNPSKRYHAANAGITVKTRTLIVCKDASYIADETGFSVGGGRPISPPPRYQKTIHAKVAVTHTTTVATPSIFNSRISLRVGIRRLTTQAQRPGPRDAWIATEARWPGSLQRMVRPLDCKVLDHCFGVNISASG